MFLFNYRGYGRSGGSASPDKINKDVREVVEYLREQAGVTRLAVHGESIGGVAAASVARHSQVGVGGWAGEWVGAGLCCACLCSLWQRREGERERGGYFRRMSSPMPSG